MAKKKLEGNIDIVAHLAETPINQKEEWRTIEHPDLYKDAYQVSNFGRVRDYETKFIKEWYVNATSGYVYYKLHGVDARRVTVAAHRLVAMYFVPNDDPNRTCVDHIDGNKLHNEASNLRWVTHKENANNPVTLARQRKAHSPKQ